MYDVDADLKMPRQFFNGEFFGPLQHGGGDAVPVTDPLDHALGKGLAFS
jgi:hypothetical protein